MKIKVTKGTDKRGYLEFSFTWVFALIVGAIILLLAIIIVNNVNDVGQTKIDAETATQLGIILNPLETGLEESKSTSIIFPSETRINNRCESEGNFGRQVISIQQKMFNKWTETDIEVYFENKYIFSEAISEGKEFYVFSKRLEMPFKVTSLMYIIPKEKTYCFVDSPQDIKRELQNLNQENIKFENCTNEDVRVCFNNLGCEIGVSYDDSEGYVEKNREKLYFSNDEFMYGAIFSDKEIYECQVKRVMKRLGSLSKIYQDKSTLVSRKNCQTDLNSELLIMESLANGFQSSQDLSVIQIIADQLDSRNQISLCKLW